MFLLEMNNFLSSQYPKLYESKFLVQWNHVSVFLNIFMIIENNLMKPSKSEQDKDFFLYRTILVESNSLKLEFKLFLCNPRFLLDSQLHLLNAHTILVDLNLTKTSKTSDVVETNLSYHR